MIEMVVSLVVIGIIGVGLAAGLVSTAKTYSNAQAVTLGLPQVGTATNVIREYLSSCSTDCVAGLTLQKSSEESTGQLMLKPENESTAQQILGNVKSFTLVKDDTEHTYKVDFAVKFGELERSFTLYVAQPTS